MLEASDPFARYRELYHRFAGLDTVQRTLYTDCAIILPDLFFEKVDKATMAHGVEVRVPLVDTRLAAYVMGLPAKYKVRWLHKKRILRRALRGVVPDEILDRPKVGFGVPASHWLRTTLAGYMRDVLLDDPGRAPRCSTLPPCARSSTTTWRDGGTAGRSCTGCSTLRCGTTSTASPREGPRHGARPRDVRHQRPGTRRRGAAARHRRQRAGSTGLEGDGACPTCRSRTCRCAPRWTSPECAWSA